MAIERHLNSLPEPEREAFRQASTKLTAENILLKVQLYDDEHKSESRFRPQAENITRFSKILDHFMAGITIAIQASPNIPSVVVGAVRVVIDVAIGFVPYFTRVTERLARLGNFLGPLMEY